MPVSMATADTLAPEEVYAAKRREHQLASNEELQQSERKALRRQKKRVHKRRDDERDGQQKLLAKLAPDSAAAKNLAGAKVERDLAEFKRKGTVSTGSFEKAKKGEKQRSEVRSDFTKSSQFFKKVGENVAAAGTAGGKRKRGPASDDPARTSANSPAPGSVLFLNPQTGLIDVLAPRRRAHAAAVPRTTAPVVLRPLVCTPARPECAPAARAAAGCGVQHALHEPVLRPLAPVPEPGLLPHWRGGCARRGGQKAPQVPRREQHGRPSLHLQQRRERAGQRHHRRVLRLPSLRHGRVSRRPAALQGGSRGRADLPQAAGQAQGARARRRRRRRPSAARRGPRAEP
eukprot:scaffold48712_cov56-Phaeocystis_antarctica.AAC.1